MEYRSEIIKLKGTEIAKKKITSIAGVKSFCYYTLADSLTVEI